MRRLRSLFTFLFVVGIAGVVLVSPRFFGDPDLPKNLYVESNERLLARIGKPPGAREVDRYTQDRRDGSVHTSWRTTIVYAAEPSATPRRVLSFYRRRLPRFTLSTRPRGCLANARPCRRATFVFERSDVIVDTSRLGSRQSPAFSVTADYGGDEGVPVSR